MKRLIAIGLVCLFCSAGALVGCTAFKADVAKVETEIKAVDWAAIATWYDKAVGGLDQAAKVATMFLPQDTAEIAVATTCIDATKAGVDTLTTLAASAKAGTATTVQLQTSVQQVESDYKTASNAVGSLLAKSPAAKATSSVPTPVTPAGSSK